MSNETSRSNGRDAVWFATVASGAMIAQQVAGKATRDALFLTQFDVATLPGMMAAGAVLSFVAALVAARALAKFGPRKIVRWAFALGAFAFAAEFAASFISKNSLAIIVYLHMALFGATLISLFWSLINERFDPHTAKPAVARIAGGGTLGGVVGGALTWQIADLTSARVTLLVLAVLNLVSLLTVLPISRHEVEAAAPSDPSPSHPPPLTTFGSGLGTLRAERYLLGLGLMVAVIASIEALIDWTFAARATRVYSGGRSLLAFFSAFHTIVSIVTFLAQALLSRRALEKVGLSGTIAVLPLGVIGLAGLALGMPGLGSAVVLRGGETVISNSLWRSGYELLYTPIAQSKKRSTKTLIDVGCDRLGTLLGSGLVSLALWVSDVPASLVVGIALVLGIAGLGVTRLLHRGYVSSLEESLRTGTVRLEEQEVIDATTRRTLSGRRGATTTAVAREALTPLPAEPSPQALVRRAGDHVASAIGDLRSGNRRRIQRVLCAEEDDPALAAFVVPLLARDEVRAEALAWLRRVAPRIAGQLVDAMLDPTVDGNVRRRIPRLLRTVPTQLSVEGLVRGLFDPRFDVRYECGIGLARLLQREPSLRVPVDPVLSAVRRELAVEQEIVDVEPALDPDEEETERPFYDALLSDRASRGLEHVFTILSLMLEREPLRIAWRALNTDDDALRGTALEYLENVLPPEIREALWPYVSREKKPEKPVETVRDKAEVLSNLLRAEGLVAAALAAVRPLRKSHA